MFNKRTWTCPGKCRNIEGGVRSGLQKHARCPNKNEFNRTNTLRECSRLFGRLLLYKLPTSP